MFELNKAIKNWRNELSNEEAMTGEGVEELESHLYEQVDSLITTGLSEEEAFMVATHRIGQKEEISQEFAMINSHVIWRTRVSWIAIGILIFFVSKALVSLFGSAIMYLSAALSPHVFVYVYFTNIFFGVLFPIFIFYTMSAGWLDKQLEWLRGCYRTHGIFTICFFIVLIGCTQLLPKPGINVREISLTFQYALFSLRIFSQLQPVFIVLLVGYIQTSKNRRKPQTI